MSQKRRSQRKQVLRMSPRELRACLRNTSREDERLADQSQIQIEHPEFATEILQDMIKSGILNQ